MIELCDVTKSYGNHRALDGVSLEIRAGVTTALIGPSGCGKSTALRLMIGLIEPDSGDVRFDGSPIARDNLTAIRKRVGYAIQSGGLFPHMSARRNVELPARKGAMSRAELDQRVSELASMLHIEGAMLDRYPSELSGGQRQRIALMRALVLDPEVLLLDEPLGALDPLIRSELQHEFRELFASLGKAVVLVTHDLAEAAYMAPDDIVLLREGRIEQRGPFAEFRSAPSSDFVVSFIAAQTERVEALAGGGAS